MSTLGIFLRGICMGICDLIPGISGGTIALITGIYERLIGAVGAINPRWLSLLFRGQWKQWWQYGDIGFLLTLGLGIGMAIVGGAHGIGWLMEVVPIPFWSFFFGLLLASIGIIWQRLRTHTWVVACMLVVGVLLGAAAGFISGSLLPDVWWGYALSGFIAISAMLLPGISGSMLLVLLGKYAGVLAAVRNMDLAVLSVFALGCALGVVTMVRVIRWALHRAHDPTMGLLLGLMVASLWPVWPWRVPATILIEGQRVVVDPGMVVEAGTTIVAYTHYLPMIYDATIAPAMLGWAVLCCGVGMVVPLVLRKWSVVS